MSNSRPIQQFLTSSTDKLDAFMIELQNQLDLPYFKRNKEYQNLTTFQSNNSVAEILYILYFIEKFVCVSGGNFDQLSGYYSSKKPDIKSFLHEWSKQECRHGDALFMYAELCNIRLKKIEAATVVPFKHLIIERFNAVLSWMLPFISPGVHMIYGGLTEITAQQIYAIVRKNYPEPILSKLLGLIAGEESAHRKFYSSQAQLELNNKWKRIIAGFALRAVWRPVGTNSTNLQTLTRNVFQKERDKFVFLESFEKAFHLDYSWVPYFANHVKKRMSALILNCT